MVEEAEKYKAQDEANKQKVEAKNSLENYAYTVRNTINDPKVADKLDSSEKATVEAKINETVKWLDANHNAEKEEFEAKMKELESVCNPVMMKLYQGGSAAGGMDGGAYANAKPHENRSQGPTVEEVD
eukprot:GILK01004585.1.p1 GENE.GILK01004585.1~~GILK01004585.1.p1  ORF type:complete len:128 (-),score=35.86 GILK01004585.1:174-557(-)